MASLMLIHPNPKKRKSGKRRSAAQRAATAKMLAANRAARGGSAPKRKYKRRTSVARTARRYARRGGAMLRGFSTGAIMGTVKNASVGAIGALGVDVAMGAAGRILPASVTSPIAADGTTNYGYYATKGALAIALGVVGGKVISPSLASKMAEGSLTVTLHDAAKTLIPAGSVPLGYASSAMVARGNVRRLSEYVGTRTREPASMRESASLREYVRR